MVYMSQEYDWRVYFIYLHTQQYISSCLCSFVHKKPIPQYFLIMGICFINNSSNVTQDSSTNIIIIHKKSTGKYDVLGYNKH